MTFLGKWLSMIGVDNTMHVSEFAIQLKLELS